MKATAACRKVLNSGNVKEMKKMKKAHLKLEENRKVMLVRHSPYCRSLENMMRN